MKRYTFVDHTDDPFGEGAPADGSVEIETLVEPDHRIVWSVVVRTKNMGHIWAKVFMDSTGALAIISDFGDYAYHWSSWGDRDFREFLLGLDDSYLGGKLDIGRPGPDPLDEEATVKRVREEILGMRRRYSLSKSDARHEWELVDDWLKEGQVERWLEETTLEEAWELLVYHRLPGQLRAFLDRLWPLVKKAIALDMQPPAPKDQEIRWRAAVTDIDTRIQVEVEATGRSAFAARNDALRKARQRGIQGSIDTVDLEAIDEIPFGKVERSAK
jgi:hypothetical protein